MKAAESEDEKGTYRGIASAVFFDISLKYKGKEIEPDVPLQVEIELKKGGLPLFDGQDVEIIHFGEAKTKGADGTELIDEIQYNKASALADGMPDGVVVDSLKYEQTGFSVVGAITTDDYIDFEKAEYVPNLSDIENLADVMLDAAPVLRASGDPTINAGKTVTDTNGDGIYELALSVNATSQQSSTADVTKSNVVMVIDVSGSMDNNIFSEYEYDSSTYNSNSRYYTSTSTDWNGNPNGTRVYYSTSRQNWYTTQNPGSYSQPYTGPVYLYETRMSATKRAACAVVDALLAYNENDDHITDVFEITLVKFSNNRYTEVVSYNGTTIRDQTNGTLIKNAINSLSAYGGTNWQAALTLADTEADYFASEGGNENTSVIFLTDGFPTRYGFNTSNEGGNGQETNSNIADSYSASRGAARTIISDGYMLYNIFAFGSDTTTYNNHTGFAYLRALTNYAYGSGNTDNYNETDITRQYAFNAKSTADLIAAFETIIDHITNNVGYAGVNLSDGVSLGATSTSVAVNGTAKPESMRYTVKDANNKLAYTVQFNSSNNATFTIYNADGSTTTLTDNTPETVTTTINGTTITSQVYSVTVGTGENAKIYKMSPATINADTGMVKWDLAGLGILESGYTYTVAFDVWPNQLAYDIAADLNNGIYASVDAALDGYHVTDSTERQHIKDAIVHNADGSYSLYTNYSQEIEYYPATAVTDEQGTTWTYGDKQTQDLPHPDPVPLQGSLIPLRKAWAADLDMNELKELLWVDGVEGGTSTEYKITLYIWKADTEAALDALVDEGDTSKAYITQVLGWDETENAYIFEKGVAVAPGTMVNLAEAASLGFDITDTTKIRRFTNDQGETRDYYVIENGHYYYVTEDGSDLHFELETSLYHPMVVDGTLYNVFFGPGQTVEKMDPMYAVVATNALKGGLDIFKEVYGSDYLDDDAEPVESSDAFAYEIKIWKEAEGTGTVPVYTTDDQFDSEGEMLGGALGWRIYDKDMNELEEGGRGAIVNTTGDDANPKIVVGTNETTITVVVPANEIFYLANVPTGTHYSVKEIPDASSAYKHFRTTLKETKDFVTYTDKITKEVEPGQSELTDHTIADVIKSNTSDVVTFSNWAASFYVYHSGSRKIEQVSFSDERVSGTYDANTGKYVYSFNIVEETGRNSAGSAVTAVANKDDVGNVLDYSFTGAYHYGGYYKVYGGAKLTDAQINGTAASGKVAYDATGWATDSEGEAYDGKSLTSAAGTRFWLRANAYSEANGDASGDAMKPVVNGVYYLKEVPVCYLQTNARWVYDMAQADLIFNIYPITCVDDTNYKELGFTVETDALKATISTKFTYQFRGDPENTKYSISASDLISQRGYLGIVNITDKIGKIAAAASVEDGVLVKPYWDTPDSVKVTTAGFTFYSDGSGTLTNNNIYKPE